MENVFIHEELLSKIENINKERMPINKLNLNFYYIFYLFILIFF